MSGTIRIHVLVSATDPTQAEVALFSEGAIMNAQFKKGLIDKAKQAGLTNPVISFTGSIATGDRTLIGIDLKPGTIYHRV